MIVESIFGRKMGMAKHLWSTLERYSDWWESV